MTPNMTKWKSIKRAIYWLLPMLGALSFHAALIILPLSLLGLLCVSYVDVFSAESQSSVLGFLSPNTVMLIVLTLTTLFVLTGSHYTKAYQIQRWYSHKLWKGSILLVLGHVGLFTCFSVGTQFMYHGRSAPSLDLTLSMLMPFIFFTGIFYTLGFLFLLNRLVKN